jgi:chromosomal replication initiation ATPase DnaA
MINKSVILKVVCDTLNVNPSEVLQPNNVKGTRLSDLVYARQLSMVFARKFNLGSLRSIGYYYGRRNHSTCVYAKIAIQNGIDTCKAKKAIYDKINIELLTFEIRSNVKEIDLLTEFDYPLEEISVENLSYQIPK